MNGSRRLIVLVAFAVLLSTPVAHACPVCFGAADSPLLDAARAGVLAMVFVTLAVLGAFAAFFLRVRRLAAAHAEPDTAMEVRS